jgi:hypothetical protein
VLTPVDVQDLAADVIGLRPAQERHHGGDIGRLADAA